MTTRFTAAWRTGLTLVVLAAFSTVVAGGALFACPFMQAPSCCSKSQPAGHCPAENPERCLLAISENKIATATPKITAAIALPAAPVSVTVIERNAEPSRPSAELRDGRETYLLNRVFLI